MRKTKPSLSHSLKSHTCQCTHTDSFFSNRFLFFILVFLGVTDTVFAFGRGIFNTVSDGFGTIINRGTEPKNGRGKMNKNYSTSKNRNSNKSVRNGSKNSNNGNNGLFGRFPLFNSNRHKNNIRGRHINPWRPFWQFLFTSKKVEKKSNQWFQALNFQTQNVGNRIALE